MVLWTLQAGSSADVRFGLVSNPVEGGDRWLISSLRRTVARLNQPAMPQATPSFHSHHFKFVIAVVLTPLKSTSPFLLEDLVEMGRAAYLSCERREPADSGAEAKPCGDFVSDAETFFGQGMTLFHWLVWHAAQYCVMTKLRTPFGKPQETFFAIEGE
jgi:hypothetical protein